MAAARRCVGSTLGLWAFCLQGQLGCQGQANSPASSASIPAISVAPASTPSAMAVGATPSAPPSAAALAPTTPSSSSDAGMPDELTGKTAPDFHAVAQDGSVVHLAALRGKTVVVYFYPKDETPGCTKEACSFRDAWQAIAATGAVLIGISADDRASHSAFAQHYKLPFRLVSDADGAIGRLYGVPFQGIHKRQTFVVGTDGTVRKVYRTVDVSIHAQQVLADLAKSS